MKTQVWQAILREADRFGFEPSEPHWLDAKRSVALHDLGPPQFWWSDSVPFFVGFFTTREAHKFALTLGSIFNIRRDPQLAREESPFNEEIELGDLSAVIDIARRGAFSWDRDRKAVPVPELVFVRGISADAIMKRNRGKIDPPGEPPDSCDLSERAEIRRLGAEPRTRGLVGPNEFELTWWGWRAILCISAMTNIRPFDPEWRRWLNFYAYYDPERRHDWWNTGYLHISTLSKEDTAGLKSGLLRHLAEPNAQLRRLQAFPADQVADKILALSSVSNEEVRAVVDLCEYGALRWTVYSDGIIVLTGQ